MALLRLDTQVSVKKKMPKVLVNYATSARGQKMISLLLLFVSLFMVAALSVGLDLANSIGTKEDSKQNAVRISGALAMVFVIAVFATAVAAVVLAFGYVPKADVAAGELAAGEIELEALT